MAANVLSRAVSPPLLQHANNPVHWRMWTPAALHFSADFSALVPPTSKARTVFHHASGPL